MIIRCVVGLAVVLPVAGCGFQPLYMPTASGKAGVGQRELASVFVDTIPERPGQELRQALQEQFGDDAGTPAQYELRVAFSIAGEGVAVQPNSIITRVRMTGNASWTLTARDAAHSTLTSGSARSIDGVNVFDEEYFASDLETEVVQQRIAHAVAQQITTQLAIWFRHRAAQQAAGDVAPEGSGRASIRSPDRPAAKPG